MQSKFNYFMLAFLPLFMLACEKDEKDENPEVNSANDQISETRDGEYSVGYYHNEILNEVITIFRVVTPDNSEAIYEEIKSLSETYYPGHETFDYGTFDEARSTYIPDSYMTMEDVIDASDLDLFEVVGTNLNDADLITDAEKNYYTDFGVEFFESANFDEANTVIASYVRAVNLDESLSEQEVIRLQLSFDIGKYSLSYWDNEMELGADSRWDVISSRSEDRRPRWITALLKIGADICGGAVGAGVGSLGGPVGTVIGGLAGGSAASGLMWN